MNASHLTPPSEIKPWLSKTGPLISFLCDNGILYLSPFANLSAVSREPERLEIHAPPHGFIVIAGPEVRDLCAALEVQRATMIRADKVALTSVIRLSEKEWAAQQLDASPPPAHPDPDLDEVD